MGPFTLKQSAILGGGGILLLILWSMVDKWLFFVLAFPITLFALFGSFLKINGRPLIDFVGSFFSFFISPQLYIWQKRKEHQEKITKKKNDEVIEKFEGPTVEITNRAIRELAKKLEKFS